MSSRAFRRSAIVAAAFGASALVLAGCSGSGGGSEPVNPDEPITLTISTFNDLCLGGGVVHERREAPLRVLLLRLPLLPRGADHHAASPAHGRRRSPGHQ